MTATPINYGTDRVGQPMTDGTYPHLARILNFVSPFAPAGMRPEELVQEPPVQLGASTRDVT
jgi:hypothetical protein